MQRKYMSLLLNIVKTMKYSTEQKTESTVRGEHSTGRAQHGENSVGRAQCAENTEQRVQCREDMMLYETIQC